MSCQVSQIRTNYFLRMRMHTFSPFFKAFIFALLIIAKPTVYAAEAAVSTSATAAVSTIVMFPNEILQISDAPEIKSSILIADKSVRKLYFFESEETLTTPVSFEIDIGKNSGAKTKRNDKKTPEGIYLLQKKMTPPEIPFDQYGSLAFATDYPNVFDKFENKTGDGIWLHSVPDTVPLSRGSKGCVVLRNESIQKLSDQISLNKSHLIINSKTEWIDSDAHTLRKNKVINWLTNWKDTWQKQDLENYGKMYSDEFSAPNFNKKSWLMHKEKLKGIYKAITLDFSKPSIFHTKNQYLIKFVQNYTSDMHQDKGIKTLYLIEKGDDLLILREEWSSL
ncbi:hypothetical protein CIK05_03995 [Bdellovibrio sp. qaytius]|nr:hypothetical protein CIK05_03995 [Bdellovibrio sp. qaytius]